MAVGVVLVAAGRGRRFGKPKQFQPVAGRPLYQWPLRVFERMAAVKAVAIVVPAERAAAVRRAVARAGFRKVTAVVPGGAERLDSVRAGLRALPPAATTVLIHDAARALVDAGVVARVIAGVRRSGAALAAWPVPDTVKEATLRGGRPWVRRTVPRAGLWLAQTPQGFRRDLARSLFEAAGPLTDDAQALERSGRPVELVPGSSRNFKVTVPEDIALCRALLRQR